MNALTAGFLPALPLLPLLAGLAARRSSARTAARITTAGGLGALGAALVCAVGFLAGGPANFPMTPAGVPAAFAVSLRMDIVTVVMGLLVAALGVVILRFSRHYLDGEPRQARFFSWLSLTLAAVLTLVVAGNLALILAAWIATSLCLHRLLLFYPGRAGAVFAARKKFVVSRLGDACLFAAVVLVYGHYGTGQLTELFRAAGEGDTAPLPAVGLLLTFCAALKSAQFPFHSWLPDTMETPTPVSAFMHAGIINAGGFLIIRLSPLLSHAPAALNLLAILGAVTAAFGAVTMLAQPSVKRALAYSTIAQMGFMLLQCGLGAFGLALLHIVAHSLYKAHAFLNAGGTIGARSNAAICLRVPALGLGVLVGGLLVTLAATVLAVMAPAERPGPDVFLLVLTLALAYGLARLWSAGGGWRSAVRGGAVALAIAGLSLGLHAAAASLVPQLPAAPPPAALLGAVGFLFGALFLFQALLWRARRHPVGRVVYVHALNGFYVGTWANRLLGHLWPRHKTL